ncbi:hypothetical protein BGHDH14_bgh05178 [Blumeria hordei DH14]|uniref:DUF1765-domain-containing protein n=1 Tax=Blumeria graminis f. sp. hordei (strain DH14) TaxID=546991 RepID=N1J633_BLUG1|nr:hypothetical protein BGHDH14_bgh05178 [Blumeria hordei DH14]
MHGFALAIPSPFGAKVTLPRSLSSPTLPDLSKSQDISQPFSRSPDDLPRSASYTSLPNFDGEYKVEAQYDTTDSSQVPELAQQPPQQTLPEKIQSSKEQKPSSKRQSLAAGPKAWMQRVKGTSERHMRTSIVSTTPSSSSSTAPSTKSSRESIPRTVSDSLATFSRKPWSLASSKSSSSRTRKAKDDVSIKSSRSRELPLPKSSDSNASIFTKASNDTVSTDSPIKLPKKSLQKTVDRPSSAFLGLAAFNSTNSSTSSLPRSSLDNRSTPRTSTDKIPPPRINSPIDGLTSTGSEGPRKRDELWSAFRSLDNDYSKFQAKSWSLKTNIVRSSLLPFLRSHPESSPIGTLRPDDLERRVATLNKWWIGLLEVLDGRQNQTVSGVDRPVLLEACFEIMVRPEWRPSISTTLVDKSCHKPHRRLLMPKRSSASLMSTVMSPFMIESVYHNTVNTFIQNLTTQINFVVNKMSLRHAPASLVNFCGKAIAYAFFFVPGMAEILVRLWKLQPDVLRRVSDELGLPRMASKADVDEIVNTFPSHLQCLGWQSVKAMSAFIRKSSDSPLMTKGIPWYGPWVARWSGRDSDLFFIFVKHFHILMEEFIPSDLSLREKARAPAQTLTAIDATIHRQPAAEPLPITFDDVLAGADASAAAALPLPSSNSARLMAENRLIMLLRDFLCEKLSKNVRARLSFGEVFGKMMQAGARRTSLFDHNACFVLCDFMEEALTIFARSHQAHTFIDWKFWLDVCQKMLESENSMSEIRLFSFLYSVWNILTTDEGRKEVICIDWLLTSRVFDKYFNHWCPMIRAYYMRLLCWRICRNDGDSSDLDAKIFHTVLIRLKSHWAHYLYMKEKSEENNTLSPSTAPCYPAPGRRLLIIRNDNQSAATPLFLGFDDLFAQGSCRKSSSTSGLKRNSSTLSSSTSDAHLRIPSKSNISDPKTAENSTTTPFKKRWFEISKNISRFFPSRAGTPPASVSENPTVFRSFSVRSSSFHVIEGTSNTTTETSNGEKPESSTIALQDDTFLQRDFKDRDTPDSIPAMHRAFSFKFSLEWAAQIDPNIGENENSNGNSAPNGTPAVNPAVANRPGLGPGERKLSPPRLPAPAQAWLGLKIPGASQEVTARDWFGPDQDDFHRPENPTTKYSIENDIPSKRTVAMTRPEIGESKSRFSTTFHDSDTKTAIYKGRALAEWASVVGECNSFLERRRSEGVPSLRWVEVPTLGVEGFRRFGQ